MKKRFFSFLSLISLSAALLSGCASSPENADAEAEEEVYSQTLTVSDPEYYTRFKDDGISINVYNWGE